MNSHQKLKAAIFGLAIGDALGVPVEFMERGTFFITGMTSGGRHQQREGTWSDDTSLTLATCYSLKRAGEIDLQEMVSCFRSWLWHGSFAIDRKVFDVGGTCSQAINVGHGLNREDKQGNGSLMRILPLAFVENVSDEEIAEVSALTHDSQVCKDVCILYVQIAQDLLSGLSLQDSLEKRIAADSDYACLLDLKNLPEEKVSSSGHAPATLTAALWCLANTNSYQECVLKAVNLGDDADTTAAVAGGLAGILYGYSNIPKKWIFQLRGKNIIKECLFL